MADVGTAIIATGCFSHPPMPAAAKNHQHPAPIGGWIVGSIGNFFHNCQLNQYLKLNAWWSEGGSNP